MAPARALSRRVVGVGVDVVSISRLGEVRQRRPSVIDHVCAAEERPQAETDLGAARLWAGKEAVAKTLGTGFWQSGVGWPDIQLWPDGGVTFAGAAARLAGNDLFALTTARRGDHLVAVAVRWRADLA